MTRKIWTDGGCHGNKRDAGCRGAWAFIVTDVGDNIIMKNGGVEENTTNNRMELTAAIQGIKSCINCDCIVMTDSKYLSDGVDIYIPTWKKNNWRKSDGSHVMNIDLWLTIDALLPDLHSIRFQWVKGHATNKINNLVDKMTQELLRK